MVFVKTKAIDFSVKYTTIQSTVATRVTEVPTRLGEPMFIDNTRTWVILVGLVIIAFACVAFIARHLTKRRKRRRAAEVTAKAAKLKERAELGRELRWSHKQLDMLRFSGRVNPRKEDDLLDAIARLEKRLRHIADEPEDPSPQ